MAEHKIKPTPLERFEWWRDGLAIVVNSFSPQELRENPTYRKFIDNYEDLALQFMQMDEDQLASDKKKVMDFQKQAAPEQVSTQMITISIDQKLEPKEAVYVQQEVIEKIRMASYKCLTSCSHRFEYFTKEGWNPHIRS